MFYIGYHFLVGSVLYTTIGYIHCPGAGVGDVCNPRPAMELDESFMRLIRNTLFIGTLLFVGNCLALVKALLRERFRLLTLLTTLVTATMVGLPFLVFLSGRLDQRSIFSEFNRMRFLIYFLSVAACVGLMSWLLGRVNKSYKAKNTSSLADRDG
jgi:hypothetical protein